MKYESERIGFGSYPMGVAADLKQPPFIGLDQGISWGAPIVEVQGEMGRVGNTGIEAIKNLAHANNVEVTWHVPPNENYELALPRPEVNEKAKRSIGVGIDHASKAGIKLVNVHPTLVLPRIREDEIYAFDNETRQISRVPVPTNMDKKAYLGFLNEQKRAEIKERVAWADKYVDGSKKTMESAEPIKMMISSGNIGQLKEALSNPNSQTTRIYASMVGETALSLGIPKGKKEQLEHLTQKKYLDRFNESYNNEKKFYNAQRDKRKLIELQYGGWEKKGFITDGRKVIDKNAAKNLAHVAKKAIDKGIIFSIENTDERNMYSTPHELNQLVSEVKKELKRKGVPKSKIEKYVGVTYDMGHAATMQGIEVTDTEGNKFKIGSPSEFMSKIKHDIKEVHAHENFGDVDAHLPVGEAFPEEERQKMVKYLKKHSGRNRIISEGAAMGSTGPGYHFGLQLNTDLYSAAGTPTELLWGPTYVSSAFDEGIFLPGDKREHYFYSTFTGGLF